MTEPGPIRVVLADDEPILLFALGDLLRSDGRFAVVGEAHDAREAAALTARLKPDVAILDVRMPYGGAAAALRAIRQKAPGVNCLVLSAHADRETIFQLVREGAAGYLVKGSTPEQIIDAVRDAASGQGALSGEVTTEVVRGLADRLRAEAGRREQLRARETRMRSMVAGKGVSIVFQPIADLTKGTVTGYEALARFAAEPESPPDVWFAEAREIGMGDDLEAAAILLAVGHVPELLPAQHLAVNVSPAMLLDCDLRSIVNEPAMRRLTIEITEHASISDYDRVRSRLDELRAAGASIAVDDTGAGFASLRHILAIDPEVIKLDISLTRDVQSDVKSRALARALISFADDIGATVVAEGLETRGQLEALRDLGVAQGQGYLIGRPAPVMEPAAGPVALLAG